jgi:tetratricopeptide (TPR) repeat protein
MERLQQLRNKIMIRLLSRHLSGRFFRRLRAWRALLFLLILSGCAAATREAPPEVWRCDPQADAAVESGEWERARETHEAVLAEQPGNCLAMYHLGYIRGRLGDRAGEIQLYQDAMACGYTNDDQLYFNLGMALGDTDQFARARAAFEKAVAIAPDSADNHFGLGLMERAMGNDAAAEAALKKAIALAPRHWEARVALAQLYLDRNRWAEGRAQLEFILSAEPENQEALALWQTMLSRRQRLFEPPGDDK